MTILSFDLQVVGEDGGWGLWVMGGVSGERGGVDG